MKGKSCLKLTHFADEKLSFFRVFGRRRHIGFFSVIISHHDQSPSSVSKLAIFVMNSAAPQNKSALLRVLLSYLLFSCVFFLFSSLLLWQSPPFSIYHVRADRRLAKDQTIDIEGNKQDIFFAMYLSSCFTLVMSRHVECEIFNILFLLLLQLLLLSFPFLLLSVCSPLFLFFSLSLSTFISLPSHKLPTNNTWRSQPAI